MPNRSHRRITAVLITLGTVGFFAVLHWVAEPKPSSGNPALLAPLALVGQTADPTISIVFVIDSSANMIPWSGPDYFDLAKEGIIEFLNRPGFPISGSTLYEISVVQFAASTARDYISTDVATFGVAHWVPRTFVSSDAERGALIAAIDRLEPFKHFSASLLELGIRDATESLKLSSATGDKQIILLTTGEYRLAAETYGTLNPCPPACYSKPGEDPCPTELSDCDLGADSCYSSGDLCNRACHIRYFADEAREEGIRVSALQLGYDWKDNIHTTSSCQEDDDPYGEDPCVTNSPYIPPARPDRGGLLTEITTCDATWPGSYVRINPFACFPSASSQCDPNTFVPGDPFDVSDGIAEVICNSAADTRNPDGDFWEGKDPDKPIYSICDNCPDKWNQRQRDCNEDRVGDVCQLGTPACNNSFTDLDNDGVCGALDECDGGDDCLVAMWMKNLGCSYDDLSECDNDCNHNGELDACDAARELAGYLNYPDNYDPNANVTLPFCDHDAFPMNGLPDCCDDGSCDCDPIPTICDLDAQTDSRYVEDFESYTLGDFVVQDDGAHGWWQQGDIAENQGVVHIVNDPDIDDHGKILELGIDSSHDTRGAWSYFVEGPGLQPPIYTCKEATNDRNSIPEEVNNVVDTRPWGAVAIDIDLYIDLELNGLAVDLYVLDSNESDWNDARRAHLRFVGEHHDNWHDGFVYREDPDGTMQDHGDYAMGKWFTVTIVLDVSGYFGIDSNNACVYNGGSSNSVRVLHHPTDSAFVHTWESSTIDELSVVKPYVPRGLQLFLSSNNLEVSPGATNVFRIGRVEVRPTGPCELEAAYDCTLGDDQYDCIVPDPDANLSCLEETTTCDAESCHCCRCDDPVRENKCQMYHLCVADPSWACKLSTCGDDRLDPRRGEECDHGLRCEHGRPCDTESDCGKCLDDLCEDGSACIYHSNCAGIGDLSCLKRYDDGCQADCTWKCGDGIVSGDEECDDGNQVDGDGCQSDCTCLCGDDVVCGSEACDDTSDSLCIACTLCGNGVVDEGEQCDPSMSCGWQACALNCTWKDGFYPHLDCQ